LEAANKKSNMEDNLKFCYSLEIVNEDYAIKFPSGEKRKFPNLNPQLPEPNNVLKYNPYFLD
jgi:hypothetical protein